MISPLTTAPRGTVPPPDAPVPRAAPSAGEIARLAILWPTAATLPLALAAPPAVAIACATAVLMAYLRHTLYPANHVRRAARRATLRARGLGRGWPLALLAVSALLLAAAALHALTAPGDQPATPPGPIDAYAARGPLHAAAVLVVGAGIMPLMEELAFRGAVTARLEPRVGQRGAIAITSLAFGASHLRPADLPALLVAGLLLGALAWGARSVWPGVVAHMLWNALAVAARAHPGVGAATAARLPPAWLAALLLAAVAALTALVLRLRRATAAAFTAPDA